MYHELSRSTVTVTEALVLRRLLETEGASQSAGQRSHSQLDTTYPHQKRYNSGTDKLSKVKLGENYPRAERNTDLLKLQ